MDNKTPRVELVFDDQPLYVRHSFPADDERRLNELVRLCGDPNDVFLDELEQLPGRDDKRESVIKLRDAYLRGVDLLNQWIEDLS